MILRQNSFHPSIQHNAKVSMGLVHPVGGHYQKMSLFEAIYSEISLYFFLISLLRVACSLLLLLKELSSAKQAIPPHVVQCVFQKDGNSSEGGWLCATSGKSYLKRIK